MNQTIAVAPVRKTIRVAAPSDRAFAIFTAGMAGWWPKSHSINASPIRDIVVEPRAGGRWFERGEDGSECEWGKVIAWEPPRRLVLAWQLSPDWRFDPGLLTEVEVRFIADGDGTRIELEHRLDGYGDQAGQMFAVYDSKDAWQGMLERLAATVGLSPAA